MGYILSLGNLPDTTKISYHRQMSARSKLARRASSEWLPSFEEGKMRFRDLLPKLTASPCRPTLVNTLFSLDLVLYPACCFLCCLFISTKLGRGCPPYFLPSPPPPRPLASQHKVPFFINAALKPARSCFPDVAMRRQ